MSKLPPGFWSSPLDVAIVILNYNVAPLLRQCLRSLEAASTEVSARAIVVDNCSSDDSVNMVRTEFPDVIVIQSATNGGFSVGNNLALRAIAELSPMPRYVWLLNPDTVVPPDALHSLVDYMDRAPDVGATGPRLLLSNGELDLACRRSFPSPIVSLYHMIGLSRLFPKSTRFARYRLTFLPDDAVADVDSVVGACMLVRTELLRSVGLLDEAFFMYGEDLDWAYRIKEAGWRVVYNGTVTVIHHKRQSSRTSPRAIVEFYRSMLIFFHKHYAARTATPVAWLIILGRYAQWGLALAVNRLRGGELRPIGADR
ncbi:MAG TPA: glycosyltransferase family 2 protein [Chloroflexota bacterium]|nr:glycosyltransferase family 2 protein [Chloroflexota bacterium]